MGGSITQRDSKADGVVYTSEIENIFKLLDKIKKKKTKIFTYKDACKMQVEIGRGTTRLKNGRFYCTRSCW
jgi:hypothetical protein